MHSFVICPKRDNKKVDLEICLKPCDIQWECEPFNRAVNKVRTEQTPGPAEKEEVKPNIPQVQESDDTDVKGEITERPPSPLPSLVAQLAITGMRSKAQQLYDQVLSLKAEIEVRWFDLGKILEEIFEGRHYIDLGYTNWKDFCEVALGPLELKWRAIDYLRMTRKKCDEVGIGREIAGEIGWSRLKEIGPVVTKKNRDHWIDVARNKKTTVHMLWGKVQVALGKKTPEEVKVQTKKMTFHLFPEQEQIVKIALDVARKMVNSDKDGHLLAGVICPEFLSTYPSGSDDLTMPKAQVLHRILTSLEAALKVKFIGEVIDVETGEILVEGEK